MTVFLVWVIALLIAADMLALAVELTDAGSGAARHSLFHVTFLHFIMSC